MGKKESGETSWPMLKISSSEKNKLQFMKYRVTCISCRMIKPSVDKAPRYLFLEQTRLVITDFIEFTAFVWLSY